MTAIQKIKHAMKKIFFPEEEIQSPAIHFNLADRTDETPAGIDLFFPEQPPAPEGPPASSDGGMIFQTAPGAIAATYPPSDTQNPFSDTFSSDPSVNRQNTVRNDNIVDYQSVTGDFIHPSFLTDQNFHPGSTPAEMQKNEPPSNSMSFPFSAPSDRDTVSKIQQWEELLLTAEAPGGMTERGDFTALPSPPGSGEQSEMLTRITETAEGVAAINETLRNFEQEFYT